MQQVTLLLSIDSSQWVFKCWETLLLQICLCFLLLPLLKANAAPFSRTKFPPEEHPLSVILEAPEPDDPHQHFLQVTSNLGALAAASKGVGATALPSHPASASSPTRPRTPGEILEFISLATEESSQGSQKIEEWGRAGWNQWMRNKQNNVLMHCRRMDLWVMTFLKYLYLIMKTSLSSPVPKCCHGPAATPWKDLSSWQKF